MMARGRIALRLVLRLPLDAYLMFITYLPGPLGIVLRRLYWQRKLKALGRGVIIDVGVYLQGPEFISIDDNCWIDKGCQILAGLDKSDREKIVIANDAYVGEPGCVHIGKNVHVGAYSILSGISRGIWIGDDCGVSSSCKLYAFSHHYRSARDPWDERIGFNPMISHERQCMIEGPISIGANTGIALNVVMLPGVSIAENCFVAVNSLVTSGRYETNSIIAGAPAKVVGARFKRRD